MYWTSSVHFSTVVYRKKDLFTFWQFNVPFTFDGSCSLYMKALGLKLPSSNYCFGPVSALSSWLQYMYVRLLTMHIAIDLTRWLGTKKMNWSLAISGQAPKDMYNRIHLCSFTLRYKLGTTLAPLNVKGTLIWINLFSVHHGWTNVPPRWQPVL